jgi:hypothetical protein
MKSAADATYTDSSAVPYVSCESAGAAQRAASASIEIPKRAGPIMAPPRIARSSWRGCSGHPESRDATGGLTRVERASASRLTFSGSRLMASYL